MPEFETSFEVEMRCHFQDPAEAYDTLPFLKSSIEREIGWVTRHYGLELFKAGQVLRMSEVIRPDGLQRYLGWKGPDIGTIANIRQEIEEDITNGINGSVVLKTVGGNSDISTPEAAEQELARLGHGEFMSFHGRNLLGYDKDLGIATKLMNCPDLSWQFLVELEKMARTEKEARQCEVELQELCVKFGLVNRLIREEPPTLLYTKKFGKG